MEHSSIRAPVVRRSAAATAAWVPSSIFRCPRAATMRYSASTGRRCWHMWSSTGRNSSSCSAGPTAWAAIHWRICSCRPTAIAWRQLRWRSWPTASATAGCWRWVAAATIGPISRRPGMPWSRRCCSPEKCRFQVPCAPPGHARLPMYSDSMTIDRFDPDVARAIAAEERRQEEHIELIASENYASPRVLEAQGSVLTNKYAEGYPGKRYYGGCEFVDIAEKLAIERVKQLFGADYANVQPHSGSQANQAVYLALLQPGDTILGMSL